MCKFHKKLSNNYINENEEDSSDSENNLLINTVREVELNSIDSSHQNEATYSGPILIRSTQHTLVGKTENLRKIP